MKRATVTKPGGLKRPRQKRARVKPKERTKDSRVAKGNTPRIDFWWVNDEGDLLDVENEVPKSEECLQIVQYKGDRPSTEIILTRAEIAELLEEIESNK